MKALVKEVGKDFEVVDIDGDLETLQKLVDGYIECVSYRMLSIKGLVAIVNEEGKFTKEVNIAIANGSGSIVDIIHGTIIILGVNGDDFKSLSESDIRYVLKELYSVRDFSFTKGTLGVLTIA